MRSSKKIIVVIMILLILLLMVGGAFAYVYIATDILKTDKQLFFTYLSKATSENGFIDNSIQKLEEKKKQTPYENSGNITVGVEYPDSSLEKVLEKLDDLSVEFSGKVDSKNNKIEQSVIVDYGENVTFPMIYRQYGNKYGIQIERISKQFIAIRNENLEDLIKKVFSETTDEDLDNISGVSEIIESISFTEEEKNQILQKYKNVLNQQLLDEYFTKTQNNDETCYTLELTYAQMKNLLIKMLEATKENELIFDKINELILKEDPDAERIEPSMIDELITSINEEKDADVPNLKITLGINNKQLSKIVIEMGEIIITTEKNKSNDNLKYNFNVNIKENVDTSETTSILEDTPSEQEEINLYFNVEYKGMDALEDVQENYNFGFKLLAEESMAYDYNFNFNTKFVEYVAINEMDKAVFLNDYDGSTIKTFLTNVGTKILEINKKQMEQLGLKEEENPLLYSNPLIMLMMSFNNLQSTPSLDLSENEIQQFNDKFLQYEGLNVSGSEVNALIKTVQNNNLMGEVEIVEITLDGTDITEDVEIGNTYKVEAKYNQDGYVSEIRVTTNN